MKYSTNYNMNKPELNEQYRLEHWNNNTDIIDTELKRNADNITTVETASQNAINEESSRATTAETALQNAINEESSRATTAETALRNITDSTFKTALLNFCYPIGSLYWSSKSDNPSTLFGGTWVQIKDRFIWAKGDSDTVNATGGSKTVFLTESNLPATVTFTIPSLSLNIDSASTSHTHTTNQTSATTDGMSANEWHSHVSGVLVAPGQANSAPWGSSGSYNGYRSGQDNSGGYNSPNTNSVNLQHTHSFTIPALTTGGMSANETHSHTGSTVATSKTISDFGSGTAFDIIPPYITKYCWERTA